MGTASIWREREGRTPWVSSVRGLELVYVPWTSLTTWVSSVRGLELVWPNVVVCVPSEKEGSSALCLGFFDLQADRSVENGDDKHWLVHLSSKWWSNEWEANTRNGALIRPVCSLSQVDDYIKLVSLNKVSNLSCFLSCFIIVTQMWSNTLKEHAPHPGCEIIERTKGEQRASPSIFWSEDPVWREYKIGFAAKGQTRKFKRETYFNCVFKYKTKSGTALK